MGINIELRIGRLESKLLPVTGELQVTFVVGVKPDQSIDEPWAVEDGAGNTLQRDCDEQQEAFRHRATEWAKGLHPVRVPHDVICILHCLSGLDVPDRLPKVEVC